EGKLDNKKALIELRDAEKNVADIDFAIRFLKPYSKDGRGFAYALLGEKEAFVESRVREIVAQYNFQDIVAQLQDIEVAMNHSKTNISEITKEIGSLRIFSQLGLDLKGISSQKSVSVFFGKILSPNYLIFKDGLEKKVRELEIQKAQSNDTETSFYILVSQDKKDEVVQLMKKHEASEIAIPEACEHIPKYLKSLEHSLSEQEKKLISFQGQAKVLTKELPKLKACHDYFLWKKENAFVGNHGEYTRYTVIFHGWVKQNELETLQMELSHITQNSTTIVSLTPEENEEVPVEIENNKYVAPFELVTRMYGLPKVSELDPTPVLAVFFLVFFGFCLTDTLYGILLAAICFSVLAFMKVPREIRGLFTLVGVCGVSTTILGLIFGGYAGISPEHFPQFIQNLQVFDTTNSEDILTIMKVTFGLGAFQLWYGTIVAGIHAFKSKRMAESFFEHFSWTIFFASIAFSVFFVENPQMSQYLMIASLVFISLCLSYKTKNIFLKLIVGPFNFIQEIIGWGSNILSYARLFALGLATGVIAMVFNEIAIIISQMLPVYIGIPIMVFIILFGHTLNIAINVLGAFIHSARLQFVEFFGKFLEGGGRRFRPFERKSRYVYLEDVK
ncbi:hypothetical protein HON22_03075, partial [Candidatus Peregrinibacteria bacterium]|nr:hypothetical protein [Candidatus Peregrinibacteria bacterium]